MIPSHIRETSSLSVFKNNLKKYFLTQYDSTQNCTVLNKGVPAAITPETDQNGLSPGQFLQEYASTCGISFFLLLKFIIFFLLCEAVL